MSEFKFELGKDYYLEKGLIVYTESYLIRRGTCCGGGCRHCPFDEPHIKGNKNIKKDLDKNLYD